MKKRYHLPAQIHWNTEPTADESARLQRVILSAIGRAVESAAGETPEIVVSDFEVPESASERFSPSRYSAERSTYAIPSYKKGGGIAEVPVVTFEEKEEGAITSTILEHPRGKLAEDLVISGRNPFEGKLIAIFPSEKLPGGEPVRVHSERYVIASDLMRAARWGELFFGARSFAILEGPLGTSKSSYYVLGTDSALHISALVSGTGIKLGGGWEVWGLGGLIHWETGFRDDQGNQYLLRALFTAEGNPLFPPELGIAQEFITQIALTSKKQGTIPAKRARSLVFGEIDQLIAVGDFEQAARRLAELDAHAFALVDWETKARYLRMLADAWTREAEEIAIIEILKSCESKSELDAALGRLKEWKKYDKLFRDVNSQIWNLLVEVGKRFGDPGSITLKFLTELLQDAGILPHNLREFTLKIALELAGPIISRDVFAEIEEAARSFVEFVGNTIEGILMLVVHPEKVIDAVGQLAKLALTVQLAQMGYPPSVNFINNVLKNMAQQVGYGLKGARILGLSEQMLRQIKWAILWEVASWFIGIGEVKALASTEKLAAIGKFLRALRLLIGVADEERLASRLEHLARLLSKVSEVGHEENILRLLSHLPEDDIAHLGRLLKSADVHAVQTFAELQAKHPKLWEAASHAKGRVEALHALESRVGGLTENLVKGYQKLASRSGFSHQELVELMKTVPKEHAELFMKAVQAIPEGAFGGDIGARSFGFFKGLSERPRSMKFLVDNGYETFSALYRHAGYKVAYFEEYLDALEDLARRLPPEQFSVEYRRLLDRLRNNDSTLFSELNDALNVRRTAAGLPAFKKFTVAELDAIVARTPDIKKIRALAKAMDPSTRGSLFERWSNKYVFQKKNKVRVNVDDNLHFERDLPTFPEGWYAEVYREMDNYDEVAKAIWDTKLYSSTSRPDPDQLHDYLLMLEGSQRGRVIKAADGRSLKVESVNYLFSDIEAARASRAELIPATVWYLDDLGKPVKLF